MAETKKTWVVYLKMLYKQPPMMAVCEESEWNAMEAARPGVDTLVVNGIESEGEAESIARAKSAPATPNSRQPWLAPRRY